MLTPHDLGSDPGSAVRKAQLAVLWPVGFGRTLWQRRPGGPALHREEGEGDADDFPGPVPSAVDDVRTQDVGSGVGRLWHRTYTVVVDGSPISPDRLVEEIGADPNVVVPEIAVFDKSRGLRDRLAVGDEFVIRMPGPWDGPVRVTEVDPTSFRFVTLRTHLEAGQIEFRASSDDDGGLRFVIESWARAGDRFSNLLYNRLWIAKEVQLTLWVNTCIAVAAHVGGRMRDGVHIRSRGVDGEG